MFIQIVKKYSLPLLAFGSLLLICLIVFYQPLFSGEIANATDILTQSYFWNVFIKESLLADPCFKTWLPYVNAGTPFNGGLDNVFRPVTFLTLLLLPVHIAINYEMVIYFFLLGVFMYFYMRELGVSSVSAFLAALFLMLNGEIVSLMNAGHVNKIGAIFPVTLVFWAFERALKRKTLSAFVLAGVALGFQFWQGHVQISFYICIAVGIYYVVRAGILYWQHRNIRQISRLTVFALLMVVIFLLLSAVHFLPMISFAQVSERSQGVSYEFATSWSMPPEELITYLIPGFFGLRRLNTGDDEDIIPYWGRMPFTQTGRYFGLLPVIFMFLALCFVRNKHILTLAVLALVVLLLGMGRYIPTYKLLYEYVPGFNMFRVPQMILFLFAFATSGLAGFGAEWFLSNFSEDKDKRLRVFLIVCIAIFLLSWLITILLPQFKPSLFFLFNEALFRKGATQEIAEARFQNIFRGFLQFNVLLGIALFILGLRLVKNIRVWGLVSAIILLYLVDIWLFNEKYIDTIPIEGSHYISENDAIRYFKAHPGLYRILQLTDTPSNYGVFNKYVYHHLFSVSGYEAVGVQYYNEYLSNMALGTSFVDLLNIKYIILPKNIEFEDGQSVEVGKRIGPYKIVMDADAVLLENLNVLPRAFPVHNAYVIKTRDAIFSTLLNPAFNPRETAILEEVPNVPMSPETIPSSQSKAQITYYRNRTIQLKVSMATDGFLVLSEKYYPGWKAYVNGRQTKIYKANYTLQTIYLPKGEHAVTFAYQPTQFILGLGITIMTIIGLLGCWRLKRTLSEDMLLTIRARLKRFSPIAKNLLLMISSLVVTLTVLELYMRNSPRFQHGGDREPRNEIGLTWEKPADVKRIVVLGDSLTFGDGVKAVETYPYKLQEKLRTRLEGKFQVINTGIMGINTDQEAMILADQNPYFGNPALAFSPDLLVLTFCVNDIELMPDPKPRPETIFLPKGIHNYLKSRYRLYIFLHQRLNQFLSSLGIQHSYTEYLQNIYSSDTKEWRLFHEYLNFIIDVANKQRLNMLLVIFPSLDKLDTSHSYLDLYAKVSEIGKAKGVEVLNLFSSFQGENAVSLRVSLMNGHPNAKAYEIAAEAIYNTIIKKNML